MALFASLTFAADVTGAWSGPMQMTRGTETREDSVHVVLIQADNKITGSVGPNAEKQVPITKGTIEGSDVTLEAVPPSGQGTATFKLKVEGDKLVGELKVEGGDGEPITGKMTLSKSK